jgi:LysM repeat protein
MTMQRDMKVGMAVGVALIGIVGALFFRREPGPKDKESPPPLQNTEELDRRIGEKGKVPYLDGVEEFPDRAAPVPPPQNPGSKPSSKTGNADAPRFLTKEEEARNRDLLSRKNTPAPDPIQPLPTKKDETVATDAAPAHNRKWEPGPAGKKAPESPRSNPTGTASGSGRTHVIQAGETLSGLAARYLGSSARYREIYEANRNVLRSPDDLRDGVTIVIPDGGKPRDSQNVAGSSATGSPAPPSANAKSGGIKARPTSRSIESDGSDVPGSTPARGDAPTERLRFVPVPRGPMSAGRSQGGAGSSRSDSSPGRKPGAPRLDAMEEDQ